MIEQQGKIVQRSDNLVRVRIGPSTGCSACDAGQGCGAGIFGRLLRRKATTVGLPNVIGAQEGQAVTVGIPESVFLRLLMRFYLYPLCTGLAGAVIGHQIAVKSSAEPVMVDLISVLGAVALAGLALWISRRVNAGMPGESGMQLLRIAGSAPNERECPSVGPSHKVLK